jgi:hypothetical protein
VTDKGEPRGWRHADRRVQLQAGQIKAIDTWAAKQEPPVTHPEAIRRVIDTMLHILSKDPGEKAAKKAKKMSNGVPWSTVDDQRVRDLARSGLGLGDIAIQMNRSISVIHRHAKMLKITIANNRIGKTTADQLTDQGLKAKGKP